MFRLRRHQSTLAAVSDPGSPVTLQVSGDPGAMRRVTGDPAGSPQQTTVTLVLRGIHDF